MKQSAGCRVMVGGSAPLQPDIWHPALTEAYLKGEVKIALIIAQKEIM